MKIGKLNLDRPIALAPMESVTDLSFRLICKQLGADIVYSEFVSSEGLIRKSDKALRKMQFLEEERPIGIQIYGGIESSMITAAKISQELSPDFIDINAGCWVKNVVKQNAGAALLKDILLMEKLISGVVLSVQLPVTVKTRLGWDTDNIKIVEVAKMLETIGVAALTVHCRTRVQAHKGDVDYSWIPKIKEKVKIPIIVNGGITTPEIAARVFESTGCDGIMIGQGAINNPFIFRETKYYMQNGELPQPISLNEKIEVMKKHLKLSVIHKGEKRGVIEFRKHYSGYLHSFPNAARIRSELMKFTELEPILDNLDKLLHSDEAEISIKL
ncbi:MAG: tRNA dihydrouridine synthase B [Ignavibacteriae bacterium]|nr:MAG: tRNA dihydrouridine synthase B [Ignavibacteriota bacterium]